MPSRCASPTTAAASTPRGTRAGASVCRACASGWSGSEDTSMSRVRLARERGWNASVRYRRRKAKIYERADHGPAGGRSRPGAAGGARFSTDARRYQRGRRGRERGGGRETRRRARPRRRLDGPHHARDGRCRGDPAPRCELAAAVRKAASGEAVLHPRVAARVVRELHGARRAEPNVFHDLSDRELEVLKLIAEGLHNSEIAGRLYVSEKTVKSHVSNILSKLHLADRTQAAVYAWREGVVRRD